MLAVLVVGWLSQFLVWTHVDNSYLCTTLNYT